MRTPPVLVALALMALPACVEPPVPVAAAPLPPPLDTQALADEAGARTALAALSLVRFATVVAVFFEEVSDFSGGSPGEAAARYAEHASAVVADCSSATVTHAEGSADVLVTFGDECVLANTGAHVEGTLLLSALADATSVVGSTFTGRIDRLSLTEVTVDGLPLAGTIDCGASALPGITIPFIAVVAIGIVTAGDVGPFAFASFPVIDAEATGGARIDMSSTAGIPVFFTPAAEAVAAIDERACTLSSRGFSVADLVSDPLACAPSAGALLVDRRAYQCSDASAPEGVIEVRVEVRVPLDVASGATLATITIDEVETATHEVDLPELPAAARCADDGV